VRATLSHSLDDVLDNPGGNLFRATVESTLPGDRQGGFGEARDMERGQPLAPCPRQTRPAG
jgi:hypothetical protein